mmetsp:Transcript_19048/g.25106  ORF Transcript_19048/g.25106 Transcript_19048/m.25106 type:complete len:261 (-) Transcript_19048:390-1172(-)
MMAQQSAREGRSTSPKSINASDPKEAASLYTSSPIVKASVPKYEDIEGDDNKKITLYILELENRAGTKWIVYRRYSEFRNTYEAIRDRVSELKDFRFPNKSKFNTHADWTKERRVSGFDEYVKILVSLVEIPKEFYDFVEPTADDLDNQKQGVKHDHHSLEPRRRMETEDGEDGEEEEQPPDQKVSFRAFSAYGIPLAIFVSVLYSIAIACITYYFDKGYVWGLSSGASLLSGFWIFFLIARYSILGAENGKVSKAKKEA